MLKTYNDTYCTRYYSKDVNDLKFPKINIFDYKWNFGFSHLPASIINNLNYPKNNNKKQTLHIFDDNTLYIYHCSFDNKIGKVYFFNSYSSSKKEKAATNCLINKIPGISQDDFLQQITPYLNDFYKERDCIYDLLRSTDKDSFKLGIDLLASTNWFIENKSIISFLLYKSKYTKKIHTTNLKYILNLLNLQNNNFNITDDIKVLLYCVNEYHDLDWYSCRKALDSELSQYKTIVPMENPGRTIPKNLEEKRILNSISLHFNGLLEIANLKKIFYD